MRAQARELAFKLIFERLFVKENYTFDEEFFASLKKDEDKEFSKQLVLKFEENKASMANLISSHLVGYELDRVYKIDLAVLYLACTELSYFETPLKIVVNEAVELAKQYSTEKSSRFVNGVLSAILKDLNKE